MNLDASASLTSSPVMIMVDSCTVAIGCLGLGLYMSRRPLRPYNVH